MRAIHFNQEVHELHSIRASLSGVSETYRSRLFVIPEFNLTAIILMSEIYKPAAFVIIEFHWWWRAESSSKSVEEKL